MSKEYSFEFIGTKEDFISKLSAFPNNEYIDSKFYYFDDYIVKIVDDRIHFGVERSGHSGGKWFIPTITEYDNKIEFNGTIQFISLKSSSTPTQKSPFRKCLDKIGEYLLYIIVAPIALLAYLFVQVFTFIKWLKNKILRRPVIRLKTTEDRLFDLMENKLGCTRKDSK